jgi:anti-anti-sigma regulatory factor
MPWRGEGDEGEAIDRVTGYVRATRRVKEKFLPVSLEQKGVLNLIRLQGAIDIGGAQELKELLIQGLTNDSKVLVKLADVTDLDVTAVELLWAARCEAKASSVEFSFEGQVPESVSLVLAEAGLAQFAVTGDTK